MERTPDMDNIVSNGIIPAIRNVIESKESTSTDIKICAIGNLINAYEDYFHTGRHVKGVERTTDGTNK